MMKYSDRAIKINSSSAKNSLGEQKIYYDSSREKVEFLKAASYSADGGEVETDLNSVIVKEPYTGLVYSDLKVKIITMKGVGDGSAIRVAKAETQKKSMDKDFIFEEFYLDSYEPLGERIIVVRIEAGTPIRRSERIRESIPELQQDHYTLKNGDSIHIYKMIKRRVKDYEMYSIPFYEYANKASFRTSEGWEDIGKWYYSVSKDRMAADREIREKTNELVKGRSSRDEKIKALYDYVKDMRYVSISLNQYRLIPHSAGETFKNKYGDCKDKATLLIAMLRSIEVDAYIALTYTNSLVDSNLPTPLAFNHAIVAIPDGKGNYMFLDPTSKTPYGFLASYIQYRNALIAKKDGGELVLIPVEDSDKKKEETVGRIDLRDFGTVRVNLESVLRGESDLDDMVRNIPEKRLKEFLQVTFSEACRPMTIQINSVELDKRKSDVEYTLRIDMTVRGFLTIMGNYYAFSPLKIFQRGSYALLISKERNTDIELREPSRYTTEVTIDIPEKTTIEFVPPGTSKTNEKFGEYRYTINSTDKTIKIKTLHDLKKKRISAVDFNEFREFMTSWQDQENQNILLRKRP